MKRIESSANPVFRELLSLASSTRERSRLGLSGIEGAHLVEAFVARHGAPLQLFVPQRSFAGIERRDAGLPGAPADGQGGAGAQAQDAQGQGAQGQGSRGHGAQAQGAPGLGELLRAARIEPVVLADRLFAQASQVENGPGPIAVVATPRPVLPLLLHDDAVYLDRVQDPGNVGSVLRSCAGLGVRRVITSPGTAFCWAPKVLRAGMGAHFHLDIHEGVSPSHLLPRLRAHAIATAVHAPRALHQADLRAPVVWLFGNEGQGLDPLLLAQPGIARVAIAQTSAVESLNVGVAAAICLYEQWRQRHRPGEQGPR